MFVLENVLKLVKFGGRIAPNRILYMPFPALKIDYYSRRGDGKPVYCDRRPMHNKIKRGGADVARSHRRCGHDAFRDGGQQYKHAVCSLFQRRRHFKTRSDHNSLAGGIALKRPASSTSKRRARGEGVLHELKIGAEAAFDFRENRERDRKSTRLNSSH